MSDVELLHFSEENLHTGEGARVLHQCGVPATYKIHTHDFYELFLVSHGGAIHAVNGRSQLLSEGSFVLMRPRTCTAMIFQQRGFRAARYRYSAHGV